MKNTFIEINPGCGLAALKYRYKRIGIEINDYETLNKLRSKVCEKAAQTLVTDDMLLSIWNDVKQEG